MAAAAAGAGLRASTDAASESRALTLAPDFPYDVFPLHKLQTPQTTDLPLAVVVLCGSFSPVTYMHVRALEMARDELQVRRGLCEVVGGYLSPVHDAYGKASLRAVTGAERVRMCQLATADSCWLACSSWELQAHRAGTWTPTADTLHAYSTWLNACGVYPKARGPVRVVLVAGADVVDTFATPNLWSPQHLRAITHTHGLAIIPRPTYTPTRGLHAAGIDARALAHPCATAGPLVVCVDNGGVESSVSSTAVRDACAAGRSIKYLVPDPVAALILDAQLYAPPCRCSADTADTAPAPVPASGAAHHRPGCVRANVMRANYRALRSRL